MGECYRPGDWSKIVASWAHLEGSWAGSYWSLNWGQRNNLNKRMKQKKISPLDLTMPYRSQDNREEDL